MTAHRTRPVGPLEESTLIEVLFFGLPGLRPGWRVGPGGRAWRPPTDVYETDDALVVQTEIAGARPDAFRVVLQDRWLTISGAREDPSADRRAYHQMEVHFGEFRVEVELPGSVDKDRVEAAYHQGLLRITLPKRRT